MTIVSYASQNPKRNIGYVYMWTNLVNGMMYIGKHNGKKKSYKASGIDITKAFIEFGFENFTRKILYTGQNFSEVEEEILIAIDARNSEFFYNRINISSEGTLGFSPSIETRKRNQEASRNWHKTHGSLFEFWITKYGLEEAILREANRRRKVSKARQGKGIPHTSEAKSKISVKLTGSRQSVEHRAALSAVRKGVKMSEIAKQKRSRGSHRFYHESKEIKKSTCEWCNGKQLEE